MALASDGTALWNESYGAKFSIEDYAIAAKAIHATHYIDVFNNPKITINDYAQRASYITVVAIQNMMKD